MAVKPKLKISFTEKDLGFGHFLREAAKIRKKPFVKVGVTQAKGSKLHVVTDEEGNEKPGVKTVADVMQIHEYGAPDAGIPERSVIRSTTNKNQEKYDRHIATLRDEIFDAESGMTTEKALGLIGQEVTRDMKETIRNNQAGLDGPTPLKPSTISRKNAGHASNESTPLIDKGQLVNALGYKVTMEGGAE